MSTFLDCLHHLAHGPHLVLIGVTLHQRGLGHALWQVLHVELILLLEEVHGGVVEESLLKVVELNEENVGHGVLVQEVGVAAFLHALLQHLAQAV